MPSVARRDRRARLELAVGIALVAAAGVAALFWTWGKWPDARVDFGRELYVPWQLSLGKVLYRDVAYLNGPLAPYANALWFRLFGVGVSTIVAANTALVVLVVTVVMGLLRAIGSWRAAVVAGLVFVALFGFAHLLPIGNYNWICPYSHDLTYGIAIALGALAFVYRYARTGRTVDLYAVGLMTGLTVLTKAEAIVACVASVASCLAALGLTRRGPKLDAKGALAFAGGAVTAPAVAVVLFGAALPIADALREPFGHLTAAWRVRAGAMEFYRRLMGTYDPAASLRSLAAWSLAWSAVLGSAALVARRLAGSARRPFVAEWAAFLTTGAVLLGAGSRIDWTEAARPLPLVLVALLVATAMRLRGSRPTEDERARLVLRLGLVVLSLALLAKVLLRARFLHYGFALAMPATLVTVVALVDWIPAAIDRAGRRGSVFRAAALGAILAAVVACVRIGDGYMDRKVVPIGSGSDSFRGAPVDGLIAQTADELRRRMGPNDTLAVLPEGPLLNYLLRRENPTPYTFLAPLDLAVFGEAEVLAAYRAAPPDVLVLAHRDTTEYGVRFFGRDYARDLYRWIGENYAPESLIGAPPLRDDRIGLLILRHAPGTGAAEP